MQEIVLASDHAGFALKEFLRKKLEEKNIYALDLGPFTTDSVDYPDYAAKIAEYIKDNPQALGVLICGTGVGISIAANRYPHIRAGIAYNFDIAKLIREHNDANVIVFGARFMEENFAWNCLQVFMNTPFEGGRHEKRINKLLPRQF
jgi:ribose 5-phosphate isomerase B